MRKRIIIVTMNIQSTLEKIKSTGMSDAEIGKRINAPQSTVNRLRNGTHKTTNFERGQAIHNLAKQLNILIEDGSGNFSQVSSN